jgi:hypothetical protein
MLEASLREQHQPVSAEQARRARDALPGATQAAVGTLSADQGSRTRQHLAYQALGEWTPQQREAIRTLAAASPEVRAQAFADAGGSTAGFGESSEPVVAGAPAPNPRSASAPAAPTVAPDAPASEGKQMRAPQDQPPSGEGGAG